VQGSVIAALVPLPVIFLDPSLSLTSQILAVLLPLAVHFVFGKIFGIYFVVALQSVNTDRVAWWMHQYSCNLYSAMRDSPFNFLVMFCRSIR
jgi:hypothetical protein